MFELNPKKNPNQEELIWCTTNADEQAKCFEWSQQLIRIQHQRSQQNNQANTFPDSMFPNSNRFGGPGGNTGSAITDFSLSCYQTSDKDQCMNLIANERAHLVTLDPGEVFWGGRYHSLIPIVSERYGANREPGYFAVAVVKRSSQPWLRSMHDLRGVKACFPGVGKMAGWVLPVTALLDMRALDVRDCNNVVKNVASFFNQSCAPSALIDKHNPTGDNPTSMCSLCREWCSGSDAYAGFEGAIRCLSEVGDVAFVKHTTIDSMQRQQLQWSGAGASSRQFGPPPPLPPGIVTGPGMFQPPPPPPLSRSDLELLCPDGRRLPLEQYLQCNLGYVSADAVVTLSSVHPDKRVRIQNFLIQSAQLLGSSGNQRPGSGHWSMPAAARGQVKVQREHPCDARATASADAD